MTSAVLKAVVLALGVVLGASDACAQRQPEVFFKDRIELSDKEIQEMDQGRVVTKVLTSADKKYGVLVFGGVYINTTIEQFAASYRDVKTLLEDKVYLDVHEFDVTGPTALSDFDHLSFDRKISTRYRNANLIIAISRSSTSIPSKTRSTGIQMKSMTSSTSSLAIAFTKA